MQWIEREPLLLESPENSDVKWDSADTKLATTNVNGINENCTRRRQRNREIYIQNIQIYAVHFQEKATEGDR